MTRAGLSAQEARKRIDTHLEKGAGVYAYGPGLGGRYFQCRVTAGELELWDGFSWWPVPRPTEFNNGEGRCGVLFRYE